MKYERLARALYAEPAYITADGHRSLQGLFKAFLAGALQAPAHQPKADDGEDDDAPEVQTDPAPTYAVVNFRGVLMGNASGMDELCMGACSLSRRRAELRAADLSPTVETIFLVFDTPGGQVTGTPETAALVRDIATRKNVVSIAVGQCCSAGIYIASQANVFVACPSSIVGSIGVYLARLDDSKAMEKAGVSWDVFRAGKYKAAGLGRPLSDDERAQLQRIVDDAYEQFTTAISEARPGVASETMQGQAFVAKDALAAGLIDAVVTDPEKFMGEVIQDPMCLIRLTTGDC
jgi:protease-4